MRESTKYRDSVKKSLMIDAFYFLLKYKNRDDFFIINRDFWTSKVTIIEPIQFYNALKEEMEPV